MMLRRLAIALLVGWSLSANASAQYAPNAGPPLPPNSVFGSAPMNPPPANYQPRGNTYPPASSPYPPASSTYPPAASPYQANQAPAAGYPAPAIPSQPPVIDSTLGSAYGTPLGSAVAPGGVDPLAPVLSIGPRIREADLVINGQPGRTGRIMLGGAVNSDAGVTGQITIDERNFDITRIPRSFADLTSGTAFRGAGQTFRLEAAPGSDFKRYTVSFANPNLLGYLPFSLSVSGFLFDRRFDSWDEERLGGRVALGYRVTPDLSLSVGISGQNVELTNPEVNSIDILNDSVGDNELYGGEVRLIHDTRNTTIQASQGHFLELSFAENFGTYDFARFDAEFRQYFLLTQRADGTGRQTLSYSTKVGFSGEETPIFENYFAGGYATLRGFEFREASPAVAFPGDNVYVGGRFQWLNSVEYMFPITADDAFRGVAFVDFGTVEEDIELDSDNFRVAPGLGLRVAIPMLGPAPLAFDFAAPVAKADTDETQVFSFYMSLVR